MDGSSVKKIGKISGRNWAANIGVIILWNKVPSFQRLEISNYKKQNKTKHALI